MNASGPSRWEALYRAALLEIDRDKLIERIPLAETAIRERMQEASSTPITLPERQAIQDAQRTLHSLRRSASRTR